jgi:hypothetical protein
MKKTYMNPKMDVIVIQTQQMLAVSIPNGDPGSANDAEAPRFVFDEEGLF